MTITIVLPFVNLTGGIRLMLGWANWLHGAGHSVTVVYPAWPYRFHLSRRQQWQEFRKQLRAPVQVAWYPLECPLRRVPAIRSAFLPPADVVVATSWPTAGDVARLPPSRGRKVHVVMHHESGTGPEPAIRAIYRLPFHRIVLSKAVRDALAADFACEAHDVVPAGVDTQLFFPEGSRDGRTVLMLYHPDPRKGAANGIEALARLRARVPHVQVRVLGTVHPREPLPAWAPFEWHVDDAALWHAYSTSAALLYPSRYEGFGLPPLEAMACGCPVVTTAVGAVPEYAAHGRDALIVEPGGVAGMARELERVLTEAALAQRLASNGVETAARWSLARTAPRFGAALERARDHNARSASTI